MRRCATYILSATTVLAATAAPALANSRNDDGEDRGTALPLWWAIVLFVVVPLVASFAISLIVLIPDWTRRARQATRSGYLDDPTLADRLELDSAQRRQIGQ